MSPLRGLKNMYLPILYKHFILRDFRLYKSRREGRIIERIEQKYRVEPRKGWHNSAHSKKCPVAKSKIRTKAMAKSFRGK
jgi:hypothetical protein